MVVRNNSGFGLVFLLLLLPALISLLTLIYQLVFLFELKNEFRFKCITESLTILSENNLNRVDQLLSDLKKIKTPIIYITEITENPNLRSDPEVNEPSSLVYSLKYEWLTNFEMKCGASKTFKDNQWDYEIIYSTEKAKF